MGDPIGDPGHASRLLSAAFMIYSGEGEPLDTIGVWPGPEAFAHATANGMTVGPRTFGRATTVRVHGPSIFVGDDERYEIRTYDPDGGLQRIIRRNKPNRAVTEADIEPALTSMWRSSDRMPSTQSVPIRALERGPE